MWKARNSKLLGKRAHDLVDSFDPALSVAPLGGNKASLLYTPCVPTVLCVGPGLFVRAVMGCLGLFPGRPIHPKCVSPLVWVGALVGGTLWVRALRDRQCLMMIMGGPHLSFMLQWDPTVVFAMWWGAVGPSTPTGKTAHPVFGTSWVPNFLCGGTRLLWDALGPGGSQHSYGWDRTPRLNATMLMRGREGHGPPVKHCSPDPCPNGE